MQVNYIPLARKILVPSGPSRPSGPFDSQTDLENEKDKKDEKDGKDERRTRKSKNSVHLRFANRDKCIERRAASSAL
jgi:hypothetical protein